jgi:hypothetical protein
MKRKLALDLRPMSVGDSHHLLNIDLKVSEFPWDVEDWQLLQKFFPDWEISVATLNSTPVGFSVVELSADDDLCRIHKFAVLRRAQRIGVDNSLLNLIEYRTSIKSLGTLEYVASESACRPGDPYDVSQWLIWHGFTCEATEPEMFEGYGKDYDAYLFRKTIHEGKPT